MTAAHGRQNKNQNTIRAAVSCSRYTNRAPALTIGVTEGETFRTNQSLEMLSNVSRFILMFVFVCLDPAEILLYLHMYVFNFIYLLSPPLVFPH